MQAVMQERGAGRTKSEKCSCSLSFIDSGAYHIVCCHGLKREENVMFKYTGTVIYVFCEFKYKIFRRTRH